MVSELASHINKSRFDVRVICIYGQRKGNEMERAVEDSGASISYLGFKDSESRLKGIYRTWNELNSFKPDVVHTHLGAVHIVFLGCWRMELNSYTPFTMFLKWKRLDPR